MINLLLPIVLALPLAAGCARPHADLVLLNGAIYTVDSEHPWAEAVAIQDGALCFVGSSQEAASHVGPGSRVIDLGGRMAMPGIHDSHVHILEVHHAAHGTCLLPEGVSPESHLSRLRACAPNQVGTSWVLGYGHSIYDLLDHVAYGGRAPREILDDAIPDRPVAILEQTSHSVWANSLALRAAGFDRLAKDPPGGVIVRNADTGEPNGILLDAAGEIVMDLALAPNPELEALNDEALAVGLDLARRHGITSLVDARAYWQRGYVEAWQRAEQRGALTARAIVSLWAYPYLDDAQQIATLATLYRNDPHALLRFSQIKIYTDGEIFHTTAGLLEPYRCCQLAGTRGLSYFSQQRLEAYIRALEPVGFDFHIHAIGDRGVHEALNAIEQAAAATCPDRPAGACRAPRHRLTHVELVQPSDLSRFRALDVTADLQMSHRFVEPQHLLDSAFLLGEPRIHERLWRLRSLHEAGARVVLSSDYDVGSISPFAGMQRALTRGDQSLPDLDTAIRAYTINPAYLMRQEDRVGSLEVGKRADIVVLDRNLFENPVGEIGDARVAMTIFDGQIVFGDQEIFSDGFESGDTQAWPLGTLRPSHR